MDKKLPIIVVPNSGKSEWSEGAYSLLFVYSKDSGNFIIKGYSREVLKYLKSNYKYYFFYHSFWHDGNSRGYWRFWKNNVTIFSPNRQSKRHKTFKYKIVKKNSSNFFDNTILWEKEYKRLPNRWIKDFDKL